MEQNNDVMYELRLALYNMIRVSRGLIDDRGTILSARKRIEEAEKILNKNFNIHDVLRSDCSATLTDYAAFQAKVERYEAALKILEEANTKAYGALIGGMPKDAAFALNTLNQGICAYRKALSAGEGEIKYTCNKCGNGSANHIKGNYYLCDDCMRSPEHL